MFSPNWRNWLKRLSTPSRRRGGKAGRARPQPRLQAEQLEFRLAPATFIWTGAGATNKWSTKENWSGNVAPNPAGNFLGGRIVYDDLSFPANALQTTNVDDFKGAVFNSVTFSGSNYTLNATVGKGAGFLTLGSPAPGSGYLIANLGAVNNTINFDVILGGGPGNRQFFTVGTKGAVLTVGGKLSGNTGVEFTKDGPGTLILTRDDSGFTGPMTVSNGALRITNALALGSTTVGTTLQAGASLEVSNVTGDINEPLILNGAGPLNDGALVSLAGTNTWAGTIRMDSNVTVGAAAGSTLIITGQVSDLGSGHDLTKEGPGTVVLDPLNTAQGNIYRGLTIVNQGILQIRHSLALGANGSAANGTVVHDSKDRSGTLQLAFTSNSRRIDPNATAFGFALPNEVLTLNGIGLEGVTSTPATATGALSNLSGNNSLQGNLTFWSDPTYLGLLPNVAVGVEANSSLTIDGVVQEFAGIGNYEFDKVKPGKLVFTNNNTYQKDTNVLAGVLNIRDSHGLGPNNSGKTSVQDGAALELELDSKVDSVTGTTNKLKVTEPLTINGRGLNKKDGALRNVSGINVWANVITLGGTGTASIGVDPDPNAHADDTYFTADWSLTVGGNGAKIDGPQGTTLVKTGAGQLILPNANTYFGSTIIEKGWVTILDNNALGNRTSGLGDTAQPGTTVFTGAALHLKSPAPGVDLKVVENLTLKGFGITHPFAKISGKGAVMSLGGNNVIGGLDNDGGNILLGGNVGVGVEQLGNATTSELTLTGTLGGQPASLNANRNASGGELEDRFSVDTGATSGLITITYDMFSIPDDLRIYYDGVLIFDTGLVSGSKTITVPYGPGLSTVVEIVMNEGNGVPGTAWTYTLSIQPSFVTSGGITKFGSKRLNLQGDGLFTGDVDIAEGVVRAQNDTALGIGTGNTIVESGAALELKSSVAQLNGGISAGTQVAKGERLVVSGPGNTSVTGTLIQPITVLDGDHLWRGPVTLATSATFDVRTDGRLTVFGAVDDTPNAAPNGSDFTKIGAGKLALGGDSTYRGTTFVNQGIVNVQSGGALGATGSGTVVANGAGLELQGDITVAGEPLTVQGQGVVTGANIPTRWFNAGPAPIIDAAGHANSGRITGISADPSDSQVIYVSAAGGGAWRTKDGGQTWQPLSDALSTLFTGAIVVAPSDPRVLYLGTGEANNSALSYYGRGVFKSTDSGRSWRLLTNGNGTNPLDGRAVSKIVVDALNPNLIYVSTSDKAANGTSGNAGVWRYSASWFNLTSYLSPSRSTSPPPNVVPPGTPGPEDDFRISFPSSGVYSDVALNGATLYMALGSPGGSGSNAVFRCSNPTANNPLWAIGDGVVNSNGGSNPFPAGAAGKATNGNIKLAIGGGVLYAAVSAPGGGLLTIQTSTDGGVNWKATTAQPANYLGNSGGYDSAIVASSGATVTVAGFDKIMQTTDSGATWTDITKDTKGVSPHQAYHALALDSTGKLLTGSDGGIWRQDLPNAGGTQWSDLNGNLKISQFLGLAVHPTDRTIAYGGTQANGTEKYADNPAWTEVTGGTGDGGITRIDSRNPNTIYHSGSSFERSDDGGTTWTGLGIGAPSSFVVDNINTSRLVANSGGVSESIDRGATWVTLGGGGGPVAVAGYQGPFTADPGFPFVADIGTNTYNPDTIYAASGGSVLVTKDHGRTWQTRNNGLPAGTTIVDIEVDPRNQDTVFVVLGSKVGAGNGKLVYTSLDAGQTWANLTGTGATGLPDVPTYKLVIDPRNDDLYVGNDNGVYRSVGGGNSWQVFGAGLPNVQARELVLNDTLNTLSVGSHGRSMSTVWLDVPTPTAGGLRALSGTSVWTGPITLAADTTFGAEGTDATVSGASIATLTLVGPLSGAFDVTKLGAGKVVLAGDNVAFSGNTFVREGTLAVRNQHALGLGSTARTVVKADPFKLAALEVQADLTTNKPLELWGDGFKYNDHFTGALRNVSNFNTYSGPILLKTNVTIGVDSGSQLTITDNTGLLAGVIDDAGQGFGLTKELTGSLVLAGPDTYGGVTKVNQGILGVQNARALGVGGTSASRTAVLDGAQLQLLGGITIANEWLDLSGGAILNNVVGNNTWRGPITLLSLPAFSPPSTPPPSGLFFVANKADTLTIDTSIAEAGGSFGLVKFGAGTLLLKQANGYTGLTDIQGGTLAIQNPLGLGPTNGLGTVVENGATLALDGVGVLSTEALTLNGLGVDSLGALVIRNGNTTWQGVITLATTSSIAVPAGLVLEVNGGANSLAGPATADLVKVGQGVLYLPTVNTYLGRTLLNEGVLAIANAKALGGTANGTTVASGTTLQLLNDITVDGEALTIGGAGFNSAGALASFGANTWQGPITLTADAVISTQGPTDSLLLDRTISDAGRKKGVTKIGQGTLTYGGAAGNANTYTGLTQINDGTLQLSKAAANVGIPGDVVIGDGIGAPDSARLVWTNTDQVAATATATVNADGLLNYNNQTSQTLKQLNVIDGDVTTGTGANAALTVGGLALTGGKITVGAAGSTLTLTGDATATSDAATGTATITGAGTWILGAGGHVFTVADGPSATDLLLDAVVGGSGNWTKAGPGTAVVTQTSTNTGTTTVAAGTLLVNGQVGPVNVTGGTLGGTGTVGALGVSGGTVAPGSGPGILHAGTTTFGPNATFNVDINGLVAGNAINNYDQLQVAGDVDLGGASLTGQSGFNFDAGLGESFTILTFTGNLSNQFATGSKVFFGSKKYNVAYNANDVTLTHVKADTTITLQTSAAIVLYGQPVTFSVTVAPESGAAVAPVGTVTFQIDALSSVTVSLDVNGRASYTPPLPLAVGSHTVTATYNGDANFSSSAQSLTEEVDKGNTLLSYDVTPAGAVFGQAVTITATLAAKPPAGLIPSGTVTFRLDGVVQTPDAAIDPATGKVSITLPNLSVDLHRIDLAYSGDAGFNSFGFGSFTELLYQVNKAGTTTATVTSSLNTSTYGEAVTFSTNVQPTRPETTLPGGTVTFFDGATALGSGKVDQATGNASFTTIVALSGGSHLITAKYNGDGNYAVSDSSATPLTQVVNAATSSATVSIAPLPATFGPTFTISATVTGNPPGAAAGKPTGTVTFIIDGTPKGTSSLDLSGKAKLTLASLDAGSHVVLVRYEGDANFSLSTATTTYLVDRADTKVTASSSLALSTYGQEVTLGATVVTTGAGAGTPKGSVTFTVDGTAVGGPVTLDNAGLAFLKVTTITAGTHTIGASYDGSGNYKPSVATTISQVVNKADSLWTLSPSVAASVYGQPVTFTITVGAKAPGGGTPTGNVTVRVDGVDRAAQALASGQAAFSLSTLTAGTHTFDVSYAGDGNFNGFPLASFSQYLYRVNKASTSTLQATSSKNASIFGDAVTFSTTVTATAPGAGVPTGLVTFFDGATALGTGSVDAATGNASFTTNVALAGGTHLITAKYSGDSNFINSTAQTLSQAVSPSGSTTTVLVTPSPSVAGQAVTAIATVVGNAPGAAAGSPTGTVTFTVDGVTKGTGQVTAQGKASLSLSGLTVGSHTVTATYGGDANFATSSGTFSQTVSRFTAGVSVQSTANPSTYGQSLSFSARVTANQAGSGNPSGSVTFFVDNVQFGTPVTISAGSATSLAVTTLTPGPHAVRADYSGDVAFEAASGNFTQTVNKLGTTVVVTSSTPNPSTFGQAVLLKAKVNPAAGAPTSPTGSVTFFDGATSLGTGTVDAAGVAQVTTSGLVVGSRSITASYSGDGTFAASTSSSGLTQVVNKGTTSISTITSSLNPAVYGQSIQLTTTVTSAAGTPTGTVTYRDGTTVLGTGTLDGTGKATFTTTTLSTGVHNALTATYDGDSNFAASAASAAFTQTVSQAGTTLALTSLASPVLFGQPSVVATISPVAPGAGTPTGSVTFTLNGSQQVGPVALDANGKATLPPAQLLPGTYTITATYTGDLNFQGSSSTTSLSQVVSKGSTLTTLTASASSVVVGQGVTFTAAVSAVPPATGPVTGTVVFTVDGTPRAPAALDAIGQVALSLTNLTVGTHSVSVSYSGDPKFDVSSSSTVSVTVAKADTRTTLSTSANPVAFGTSVTLTANFSVQSPGSATPAGTVTFLDGAAVLGTVTPTGTTATFLTSALGAGTHSLTARYDGDANLNASTSAAVAEVVNKATSSLTLSITPSRNVVVQGRGVSFTVTATSSVSGGVATGSVTFTDGATTLGSVALSGGTATFTTSFSTLGNHSVRASYAGDANLSGSSAGPTTFQVGTLNQAWVSQTYLDLFHRNVDGGGLAYWTGLLDARTLTPFQVVGQLENSAEFRVTQVNTAYQTFLRRPADGGALGFWVPFLQSGHTVAELRAQLIGSDEYFSRAGATNDGFINQMYLDVYHRNVDPSGRQVILLLLQQFTPRQAIASNALQQTEAVDLVVRGLYQSYLRRDADGNGLPFFRSFLQHGGQEEDITARLIGSQEYFDKL